MKNMPGKEIIVLDIPKLIKDNFKEEDWEALDEEMKDVNDIYCFCRNIGKDNLEIGKMIKKACITKELYELEGMASLIKEDLKKNEKIEQTSIRSGSLNREHRLVSSVHSRI
jgi:hypothetical protein